MGKFIKRMAETANAVRESIGKFGKISSMSTDGRKINIQNEFDGEVRELMIVTPYGVSSCGVDGLFVQTEINDNDNSVSLGVYDPNKPEVKAGEVILYSSGAARIKLSGGSVIISGGISFLGNVTISGNLQVDGNLTATGTVNLG